MDLQKIQQETPQALLGSLDTRVEQAWRSALQTPQHPQFRHAVQMVASFYEFQGYDLKAESVLREALAAIPKDDLQTRRNLTIQLAGHFESIQELTKAVPIREGILRDPLPPSTPGGYTPGSYDAISLANLYEQMGELEKAEGTWREVATRRAAETAPNPSRVARTRIGGDYGNAVPLLGLSSARRPNVVVGGFGYGNSRMPNELADFYMRHGRTAEAEQLYQKALTDAAENGSPYDWDSAANSYIAFLAQAHRLDEAIDLVRQSVTRFETSSDPQSSSLLLSKRQYLATLLAQAGHTSDALEVQKQAVEEARSRYPTGPESVQAQGALAELLISQNRLEEAEKVVAQMRESGAADTRNAQFHESMATQTLARIRDMQKRPEEARQLRERVGVPNLTAMNRASTVYDLIGPAQQAAFQGDTDKAMALADQALALAAERSQVNPQEIVGLTSLINVLMSKQKKEAERLAGEIFGILERAPDHPRVADALGSLASVMARLGRTGDAQRASERQEKILLTAKGPDSLALNSIGNGRIELLQRENNWAGVIEERKRILTRTERATGSKSRASLYALREVAWAYSYSYLNNWPEEEGVLSTLRERTVRLSGRSSLDHAHILVQMANRASQNREYEKALSWIDQAIEVARTLPDAGVQLPIIVQNRQQIVQAKDAPPGSGHWFDTNGHWFDTNRFQMPQGTGLVTLAPGSATGQPSAVPAPARRPPQ